MSNMRDKYFQGISQCGIDWQEWSKVPDFSEKNATSKCRTVFAIPFDKELGKKMLFGKEEQRPDPEPQRINNLCRNSETQLPPKQKPSKRLPLTREWLTFDPEVDNEVWAWVNRIEVENGVIKMWQEPKRIQ